LLAAERCRLAASSRNWLLVQSFALVSGIAFMGFAIPVCRSPFRRLSGFPATSCAEHVKRPVRPLVEFRLPPESCPTQPSPPAAAGDTSLGLSLPSAHEGSEVHLPRALPRPTTVRPQGLATLSAAYALRARAGFVSHRRRSWDSPCGASSSRKVSVAFSRRTDPRTVFLAVVPDAEALGRPGEPRFPGFDPFESPWSTGGS